VGGTGTIGLQFNPIIGQKKPKIKNINNINNIKKIRAAAHRKPDESLINIS